jgi:hypothetical protein
MTFWYTQLIQIALRERWEDNPKKQLDLHQEENEINKKIIELKAEL